MNITSSLFAATATAALVLTLSSTAQAKIGIAGYGESALAYTPVEDVNVAETYDEPVCKFIKVKVVKEQYGRKIVVFKTKKVCA